MRNINITLHGRPKSKDNEKIFNRQGKPYLSKEFKMYARAVAWEAKRQMTVNGWQPFDIPIKVRMTFYFNSDQRLDLFNAPKSICDALNKIVWADDRLIHQGYLIIGYSESERVEIEVEPAYFYECINFGPHKGRRGFILNPGTPKSIIKAVKKAVDASEGSLALEILG